MPRSRSFLLMFAGLLLVVRVSAQVIVPTPAREYLFTGNLSDSYGGPALVAQGGSVGPSTYVFGANQGLLLADPTLSASSYAIEILFSFDTIGGYRRILDFTNRGADTGLYSLGQSLDFYNVVLATEADFVTGQSLQVVLTRDGATSQVSGYVNGQPRLSFTDAGGLAIPGGPHQELYFFVDDLAVSGESAPGSVDTIRIFNQPLSAPQVLKLFQDGVPAAVPEPSTCALLGLGLLLLVRRTRAAA